VLGLAVLAVVKERDGRDGAGNQGDGRVPRAYHQV
jgi:hypothetical protein